MTPEEAKAILEKAEPGVVINGYRKYEGNIVFDAVTKDQPYFMIGNKKLYLDAHWAVTKDGKVFPFIANTGDGGADFFDQEFIEL